MVIPCDKVFIIAHNLKFIIALHVKQTNIVSNILFKLLDKYKNEYTDKNRITILIENKTAKK
jgi:hypothetical protein